MIRRQTNLCMLVDYSVTHSTHQQHEQRTIFLCSLFSFFYFFNRGGGQMKYSNYSNCFALFDYRTCTVAVCQPQQHEPAPVSELWQVQHRRRNFFEHGTTYNKNGSAIVRGVDQYFKISNMKIRKQINKLKDRHYRHHRVAILGSQRTIPVPVQV